MLLQDRAATEGERGCRAGRSRLRAGAAGLPAGPGPARLPWSPLSRGGGGGRCGPALCLTSAVAGEDGGGARGPGRHRGAFAGRAAVSAAGRSAPRPP